MPACQQSAHYCWRRSSVIGLIMRFYNVDSGAVRGQSIFAGAAHSRALPLVHEACLWPHASEFLAEHAAVCLLASACARSQVRLDGVDIRELSLLWYRGQLALVSQCAPAPPPHANRALASAPLLRTRLPTPKIPSLPCPQDSLHYSEICSWPRLLRVKVICSCTR
jgi:hypothetical protein